jgi:AmmeMemoRadiSam system protein B/AmmeMemoRadiSam system protein A
MIRIKWFCLIIMSALIMPYHISAGAQVRESVISGTWYTKDPNALQRQLTGFLQNVPVHEHSGELVALIAPHAGYQYSGQVAAHAYKLLGNRKFDTVVVIAPSHYLRFEGISVYDQGGYRTPLGLMPLDDDFISLLKSHDKTLRYVPGAHAREHSLEIQVPFLQLVSPGSRLVPIVMGDQGLAACKQLANVLATCAKGKSVLLVASSDLSHYHSAKEARALDDVVFSHVARMDAEGLGLDLDKRRCEACGGGPMITAMLAAKLMGTTESEVLHTATSGDVTGDYNRVVGYMAAAIWKKNSAVIDDTEEKEAAFLLNKEEKKILHDIAYHAISYALENKTRPLPESLPKTLQTPCGAFVTLKIDNRLRGCIGHIVGRKPLAETVREMAIAAAMEDPRFSRLTKEEWPKVHIEISVMSPLRQVSNTSDVQAGQHGIYIKKGWRSGLLLPQVATEYGWDRETFLEQTCQKAGLPKDAWKETDTEIYIFTAEVF